MKMHVARRMNGLYLLTHQKPVWHRVGRSEGCDWYGVVGDAVSYFVPAEIMESMIPQPVQRGDSIRLRSPQWRRSDSGRYHLARNQADGLYCLSLAADGEPVQKRGAWQIAAHAARYMCPSIAERLFGESLRPGERVRCEIDTWEE